MASPKCEDVIENRWHVKLAFDIAIVYSGAALMRQVQGIYVLKYFNLFMMEDPYPKKGVTCGLPA